MLTAAKIANHLVIFVAMSRACKTKFLIDNLLNHVRNNALPVQSFLIERLECLTGFPQLRQHQYIKRASL
jgi:hypothetical protein